MAAPAAEIKASPAALVEEKLANCECCGLLEECTPAYIALVRERYHGRWICGLCAEAVDDEIVRAGGCISGEEALARHMTFSRDFLLRSVFQHQMESAEHLIAVMRQLLRRTLDSPRSVRPTPEVRTDGGAEGVLPSSSLTRPSGTFPTIAG